MNVNTDKDQKTNQNPHRYCIRGLTDIAKNYTE